MKKNRLKSFLCIALMCFMFFRIDKYSVAFADTEEMSSRNSDVKIFISYYYRNASGEIDGGIEIFTRNMGETFNEFPDLEGKYSDSDLKEPAEYWRQRLKNESGDVEWEDCSEGILLEKASYIIMAGHDHRSATCIPAIEGNCQVKKIKEHFECLCGALCLKDETGKNNAVKNDDDLKGEFGFHDIEEKGSQEPTCENDGLGIYYECSICHTNFLDAKGEQILNESDWAQVVIEALGHKSNEEVWEGDASGHWHNCIRDCGYKYEVIGHDPGEKNPETGEVKCKVCGYVISSHEFHKVHLVGAKESTCTVPGNRAYYVCEGEDEDFDYCGKYFENENCETEIKDKESVKLPLKEHTRIPIEGKSATCTEPGLTEGEKCSVCGEILIPQQEIPEIGHHTYGEEWSNDKTNHWHECTVCGDKKDVEAHISNGGPTETEAEICTECGYEMNSALNHEHSLTHVPYKAKSCTEDGNIEYYVCAAGNGKNGDYYCGHYFKNADGTGEIAEEDVILHATGHYIFEVPGEEATCEGEGTEAYYQCHNCNHNFLDGNGESEITTSDDWAKVVIQPLGHSFGTEWKQDKDSHWHECERIGCDAKQELGAHNPNGPATETESSVCTVCGYTITAPLVHQHIPVLVEGKAATCVAAGSKSYYECSCGKYFEDATTLVEITDMSSMTIPAAGHNYGSWKVVREPSGTEDGLKERVCSNCGNVESMVLSATGEDTEDDADNSAVPDGAKQYTSPKTGDDSDADNTVSVVLLLVLALAGGAGFCAMKMRKKA